MVEQGAHNALEVGSIPTERSMTTQDRALLDYIASVCPTLTGDEEIVRVALRLLLRHIKAEQQQQPAKPFRLPFTVLNG